MPQPTPGDVHVNGPLTNISVAYVQDQTNYIADQVFPLVPVAKQSDLYFKYSKEDFLRDEMKQRAPGTESAGGGFTLTTASYNCIVEAFHKDIDDQIRRNVDSPLDLDASATRYLTQKALIRRERRWMTSYFGTGIWGTDVTPSPLWSAANSTPRKDVEVGKLSILSKTGMRPNKLVLGAQVYSALRYNAEIIDQFKYTSADSIDINMLRGYFDVDEVMVANAVYTSTVEGAATQTTGFAAGKHALLTYTTDAPSLMTPTSGYIFTWNDVGSIAGQRIKRFRMEQLASDRIEIEMAQAMNVVASECGYFFNGAVA
jgi:hypothetical protein